MKSLSDKIAGLIIASREKVAGYANTTMVYTYFQIGKMIVEELQQGEKRAEYGTKLLKDISKDLNTKVGKGFSVQNLERMRNFFLIYSKSAGKLEDLEEGPKSSSLPGISEKNDFKKSPSLTGIFKSNPFKLSWTHYVQLIQIENDDERSFYEIESKSNQWSVRMLKRQIDSALYERLAVSKDKNKVKELALKGHIIGQAKDIIKDPFILEFLGLEERPFYSETDMETAIINEIEKFMLELGKGFFFGGRQVRFTFDEEHFRIDLVFYNRLLQCFVLIDLKIGKLTHQDLGQMQMYVNYYDRFVKTENENATIGIILCKNKNESLVEITLPKENNQIFASKYQMILPDKAALTELLDHYE